MRLKKKRYRLEERSPTPNVAVTNPDSVARNRSLHFMLTMLVADLPSTTSCTAAWAKAAAAVLECHPRSGARSRLHAGDSLVPFHSGFVRGLRRERRSEVIDDDVKVSCILTNVAYESLPDRLVLQSKRLMTEAMVRDEIMDVVQARGRSHEGQGQRQGPEEQGRQR